MEDKNLELLRFNYSNLHESLWESHKVAWTVTGLFIPVIFALQGYLAKEYVLSTKGTLRELVAGAAISELLMLFWRLMIWMLECYNEQRLRKLRAIEKVFADEFVMREEKSDNCEAYQSGLIKQSKLVMQYRDFNYRPRIPHMKLSLSWNLIYNFIVSLITMVNIGFIVYRKYGVQAAIITVAVICALLILYTVAKSSLLSNKANQNHEANMEAHT